MNTQTKEPRATELSIENLSAIIKQAVKDEMVVYIENSRSGLRPEAKLIKEAQTSYIPEKMEGKLASSTPASISPQTRGKAKKVADLSISELETFISVTIQGILDEILGDPDEGLEIRPEVIERIKKSRREKTSLSAEEVAKRLGLNW